MRTYLSACPVLSCPVCLYMRLLKHTSDLDLQTAQECDDCCTKCGRIICIAGEAGNECTAPLIWLSLLLTLCEINLHAQAFDIEALKLQVFDPGLLIKMDI